MKHKHTVKCYASNPHGPLSYTPCRPNDKDKNLKNLLPVDFEAGINLKGLTLICTKDDHA